jgi:hypothetical protein
MRSSRCSFLWGRLVACGRLAIGQMRRGREIRVTRNSWPIANRPQDAILPHIASEIYLHSAEGR